MGRVLALIALVLSSGAWGQEAAVLPADQSVLLDGEPYQVARQAQAAPGDLAIDFLRLEESFEQWTRKVGFRRHQLPRLGNEPVRAAMDLGRVARKLYPESQPRLIVTDDKAEAILDFLARPPGGGLELNVIRYARSLDGRAVVSLVFVHRFPDGADKDAPERLRDLRRSWVQQAVAADMGPVQAAMRNEEAPRGTPPDNGARRKTP